MPNCFYFFDKLLQESSVEGAFPRRTNSENYYENLQFKCIPDKLLLEEYIFGI